MRVLAFRAPNFLPDFASTLFFENHWAWWIAAGAVAGTLLFVGRQRANRSFQWAGAGVVVLAIVWLITALAFDTPAERLRAAHHEMATAAANHDVDKILSFLAADFTCPNLDIHVDSARSGARSQIGELINHYGVREIYITRYESTFSGNTALTHLTLLTNTEASGTVKTSWQLYWKDIPASDWKIGNATLTSLGDTPVPPDSLIR